MANYEVIGVGEHGKYFDENAYHDLINYIFRKDHAIYCNGYGFTSFSSAADEMQAVARKFNKDSGKRVRHSVLSFSEWENSKITPVTAYNIGLRLCQFYAPEYQIAFAVHNNTEQLHIHFVMNQISYVDGHRYGGKKHDFYEFKKFAHQVTGLPIIYVKKTH